MAFNREKTLLCTGFMDIRDAQGLVDIMGISFIATLVKYLVLPLISRRLKLKECLPLLERILAIMINWKNICISYAGRVELIKYVLSSLYQYWTRTYILPKCIWDKVKALTNKFLWEGSSNTKRIYQANPIKMCLSKYKGGLGIMDVDAWNKGACCGLNFKLLNEEDSIWLSWVKCNLIKGKHL